MEEQEEEKAARRSSDSEEDRPKSWRWRVFSTGSIIGLIFGAIYIWLPTITWALLGKPIVLLPIPFVDWTAKRDIVKFGHCGVGRFDAFLRAFELRSALPD